MKLSALKAQVTYFALHVTGNLRVIIIQFISISWLNPSLDLHLRPINLVIFQEIVP